MTPLRFRLHHWPHDGVLSGVLKSPPSWWDEPAETRLRAELRQGLAVGLGAQLRPVSEYSLIYNRDTEVLVSLPGGGYSAPSAYAQHIDQFNALADAAWQACASALPREAVHAWARGENEMPGVHIDLAALRPAWATYQLILARLPYRHMNHVTGRDPEGDPYGGRGVQVNLPTFELKFALL